MLAREMDTMPTLATVRSLRTWLKIMLTPISTTHYMDQFFDQEALDRQKVYMPVVLFAFLTLVRLVGFPFRLVKRISNITFSRIRPAA